MFDCNMPRCTSRTPIPLKLAGEWQCEVQSHREGVWGMRRCLLFLLFAVLLMLVPAPAQANGGPPRMTGDKMGVVLPGKSSTLHVSREELRFVVDADLRGAQVTARYELANRSATAERLPVIFVVQNFLGGGSSEPQVIWQGEKLGVEALSSESQTEAERSAMRQAWGGESQVVDPVTGEVYPFPPSGRSPEDEWRMQYYRFELALEAGATGTLEVSYLQHGGFDKNRYTYPIYQYQYLLLPARGWASFGPLSIEIAAPPPGEAFFASNLGLTWSDGAYRATLQGLPEQNLLFSLMSRKGILFGLVQPGPYYALLFLLLLGAAAGVSLGLGRLVSRLRTRRTAVWAGIGVGLLLGLPANLLALFLFYWAMPALHEQGYGIAIVGLGQWILSAPVSLILTPIAAGRYYDRRSR